ncbi:MAG: hypothetical protein MZW92_21950 [Comamonadaceae bacterium]|nr:hypothetical protein [Comamonadaceae bacterium]
MSDAVAEQISRTVGAGGGQVVLSAGAAKAVVDNVVNLGGKIKADVVVMIGDKLVLGSSERACRSGREDQPLRRIRCQGRNSVPRLRPGPRRRKQASPEAPPTGPAWSRTRTFPFASSGRFPGASAPLLGPAAFDPGVLAPRFLHTPPAGWTPPPGGATVMYSIHRPGGSGGGLGPPGQSNLNPGLGSTFPPGTTVAHAATHRPGGNAGGAGPNSPAAPAWAGTASAVAAAE